MLRLNSSVHSWLTRQELKNAESIEKRKQIEVITTSVSSSATKIQTNTESDASECGQADENGNSVEPITSSTTTITTKEITTQGTDTNEFFVDAEFHKQLKNEVGNMYNVWDEADRR